MNRSSHLLTSILLLSAVLSTSCKEVPEPKPNEPPFTILRHLPKDISTPPTEMDSFTYGWPGPPGTEPEAMISILSQDYTCYRYFQLLHLPQEAWDWAPYSPWFQTLTTHLPAWNAFFVSSSDTALAWCSGSPGGYSDREFLINWAQITEARQDTLIRSILDCSPGCSLFLDQIWLTPHTWMFAEPHLFLDSMLLANQDWQDNMSAFLAKIRAIHPDALLNGDWNAPPPIYLERVDDSRRWQAPDPILLWRSHPGNVLSVSGENPTSVELAITAALTYGGTIAFSPVTDSAYHRAWQAAHPRGAQTP